MFRRPLLDQLLQRLREPRKFMQILLGPRQIGKTTLARQAIEQLSIPTHFATADEPALKSIGWIAQQWEAARLQCRNLDGTQQPALLILDEMQKIAGWSETVKRLWDEDTAAKLPLRVLLLGSSPLLLREGLSESLAGRFETLRATHWSYGEMRDAFGWDVDTFIYFGGYPGAASLISDEDRWRHYLLDSLVETTISRDVLLTTRVDKPALLRRLFELACRYSGQELSYQKMIGQLQDAGNTTTLAGYLDLLSGVGMVTGLQKYAGDRARQRASSPKLQVYNTALMSALSPHNFQKAKENRVWWGRLTESAVGAHLLNGIGRAGEELYYWRERNREVDFVVERGNNVIAIEVKSAGGGEKLPGIDAFTRAFGQARPLLVGRGGIEVEQFLEMPISMLWEG
ncbi:MAG: ATP-binding protein [Candidatus Kapaibacterium sp.]